MSGEIASPVPQRLAPCLNWWFPPCSLCAGSTRFDEDGYYVCDECELQWDSENDPEAPGEPRFEQPACGNQRTVGDTFTCVLPEGHTSAYCRGVDDLDHPGGSFSWFSAEGFIDE